MRLYQGIGILTNTSKTTKKMSCFSFKGQTPLYSWDSRQICHDMSSNACTEHIHDASWSLCRRSKWILAFLNVLAKLHLLVCFVKLLSISWMTDTLPKNRNKIVQREVNWIRWWTCRVSASFSSTFSHCLVAWESSEALFSHLFATAYLLHDYLSVLMKGDS